METSAGNSTTPSVEHHKTDKQKTQLFIAPSLKMSTVRPMTAMDLFKFNPCNLDHLTETYNVTFYLEYLSKWPHLCRVIEGHNGQIEGYSKNLDGRS